MNKAAAILSVLAVVILSGGLLFVFLTEDIDKRNATSPSPSSTAIASPSPSPTPEIPDDWVSFESEEYGFSMQHPSEMTVNDIAVQTGAQFQLWGPTQEEGTEMYDGISLTLLTDTHQEAMFHEFVDIEYEEVSSAPTTEEISELQHTTVAGHEAHQFTVNSLGEFTHIYIELEDSRSAHIVYLVEDPENQGFEETLNTVLSTLQFN